VLPNRPLQRTGLRPAAERQVVSRTNRVSLEQFGPFAEAFSRDGLRVPGHLELLGLQNRAAQVVIDRIEQALTRDGAFQFVDRLFDSPNWRPHLVGAIALILDDCVHLDTRSLWRAIDAGSWVIPQLVITALMVDRDFPGRLVERVERSCPVSVPIGLSPVERHSATGPAGTIGRSAKLLASLLSVGTALPSMASWIASVREQATVVDLLKQDVDNAPSIAAAWHRQLLEHFSLRGRALKPKAA
jgi:hypothetical protein